MHQLISLIVIILNMNIPKVIILQNNINKQFTTVTHLHYDVFDIVHYVVSLVEYVSVNIIKYNI